MVFTFDIDTLLISIFDNKFLINLVYLFHIVFHCMLLFVSVAHRDLTVYALINMALLLLLLLYCLQSGNPPFCTIVTLYLQSASFLKFMTVDLFEGDIIRNNLRHVLSKMVKFENSTFSGRHFVFMQIFATFVLTLSSIGQFF